MSDFDQNELLKPEELAARLRVKRSWVYTHADDLGAYRIGKYLRFSWARVLERFEPQVLAPSELGRVPNDPNCEPSNQKVKRNIERICNR
jgi:hypothetical protein